MKRQRVSHTQTRKANREKLLAAGREVFSTIGYDAATVRDIVRKSGLAQGSFYNYFNDKQAVFEAILSDMLAPLIPVLKSARGDAETPHDFLFNAFEACRLLPENDPQTAAIISRNQTLFRELFYFSDTQPQIREDLMQDLKMGQQKGIFVTLDVGIMADTMISLGLDMVIHTATDPDNGKDRVKFLTDLFLPRLVMK